MIPPGDFYLCMDAVSDVRMGFERPLMLRTHTGFLAVFHSGVWSYQTVAVPTPVSTERVWCLGPRD